MFGGPSYRVGVTQRCEYTKHHCTVRFKMGRFMLCEFYLQKKKSLRCRPVPKWINENLEWRLKRLGNGERRASTHCPGRDVAGGGDEDVFFLYFLFPLELLLL